MIDLAKENVSPYDGTPWNSDQEVYEFATHKNLNSGWDWYTIRDYLISQGLNQEYANAIIQNLITASREEDQKPATYTRGFIVGIFSSILIGAFGAFICVLTERVWTWLVVIGTVIIGIIVKAMSHRDGWITGVIAAISGVVAVLVFAFLIEHQGYTWDDGSSIFDNILLYIGAAAFLSGWAGYMEKTNEQ